MPGHHVYTGVDNVHATFGRTKGRQALPRLTGRSESKEKSPRNFPRSCHHHNPTDMNRYKTNHAQHNEARKETQMTPHPSRRRAH